jgi:ABC-type transport system involved in multi-copper enzyme maturation permease subunit
MTGAVLVETLRRGWKPMLWWGLGVGSLGFFSIIIVPDVEALQQMAELMESLPPFLTQALGGGDVAFMATPEGYLALQLFSFTLLVFAVYAVVSGLNVTSNDEERGILDIVLSLPIARWRLVFEKFVAYSLLITGAILISFVSMWIGIAITPTLATVDMGKIVAATFAMVPASLVVLAFTLFIAAVVRRRGLAIALASVFVIGSYFIDTIGRAAPSTVGALRSISFFAYYDGTGVMQYGFSWVNVLVLLVATGILVAGGIWFFQRRDVGL